MIVISIYRYMQSSSPTYSFFFKPKYQCHFSHDLNDLERRRDGGYCFLKVIEILILTSSIGRYLSYIQRNKRNIYRKDQEVYYIPTPSTPPRGTGNSSFIFFISKAFFRQLASVNHLILLLGLVLSIQQGTQLILMIRAVVLPVLVVLATLVVEVVVLRGTYCIYSIRYYQKMQLVRNMQPDISGIFGFYLYKNLGGGGIHLSMRFICFCMYI